MELTVEAGTKIEQGAVQVASAPVNVKAETTLEAGAVQLDAPVSVSSQVQPAAPVVKAYPTETEEIIERDDGGEIKSIIRRAKE